jgi:hypothetical protein
MFADCVETVSILYAVVFGAGDACVTLSMSSILTALGAFFVLVIIAQFVARKLWARVRQPHAPLSETVVAQHNNDTITDDPNYQNSAIRSSRR